MSTARPRILILNGPNLNLLGQREPAVYGHTTLEGIIEGLQGTFPAVDFEHTQSNHEGVLIDALHGMGSEYLGAVLNAGAYSHTSIGLRDAIAAIVAPVIEVHISNTYAREAFRHHSHLSAVCAGVIVGFGPLGYTLAVQALLAKK